MDKNASTLAEIAFSPAAFPSLVGAPAQDLVRSVLRVVSMSDAMEVFQQEVATTADSDLATALLRLRGERSKPLIQAASGPAISTIVAAKRLKCSAEHIRNRVNRDELIGYPALGDRTRILLPMWQFQSEHAVHDWVPALIKAYGDNGWALLHFVTAPRTNLDGDHYLHLLQTGRVKDVLAAAGRSNPE